MKRWIAATALTLALAAPSAPAQNAPRASELQWLCDTLALCLKERTTVTSEFSLTRVLRRGKTLDLYFSSDLGDYPWRAEDIGWLRSGLESVLRENAAGFRLGEIFVRNLRLDELRTVRLENAGSSPRSRYNSAEPGRTWVVRRKDSDTCEKGLGGRNIALWQSHGLYYSESLDDWTWQRAKLHRTVEDMFTQSFVLPYLIPMLERAGAYVLTPRERDTGRMEYITDNDPAFTEERTGTLRRLGTYSERGPWKDAGTGFADTRASYLPDDNPFTLGSARQADCTPDGKAEARWTPGIEDRGHYAVYVSYKTLENSCSQAEYTVHHMGGSASFVVDQRRGGGTWMYLGSFEMDAESYVSLSNRGPRGEAVSADAVKIGGGMGKIARGPEDGEREPSTSGRPSYMEGALYWMMWAGADSTVTRAHETDYTNDFAGRGPWAEMMYTRKNIPFDLTLAFHSDAGATPGDSTVGTLAIYTLRKDGSRKLLGAGDRMASRQMADFVQSQVCNDIRAGFNPDWSRRMLWDRNYSESRTSGTPAMILELLSHQNLADMRFGHDPAFKFTASRAVYKGILKFLSSFYGCPYVVQPLPVRDLRVDFAGNGKARLSWSPVNDPLEPTATATSYMVYTRIDDGAFDNGRRVNGTGVDLDISAGHIYSYRVEACNEGGRSFPSETVALGFVPGGKGTALIVNNFTRVSAPLWFDGGSYAGFDARIDSGVPWISDLSYIGENYEYRRNQPWITDENGGHGSSWDDRAGEIIAGNTFDYISVHGADLMSLGYSFCSMSSGAFCNAAEEENFLPGGVSVIDLICGKQLKVPVGTARVEYEVFTPALQAALRRAALEEGIDLIVSGSRIATDAWAEVYPLEESGWSPAPQTQAFVRSVLGYEWQSSAGTNAGSVEGMEFYDSPNETCYSVEMTDAIRPASPGGESVLRYDRTRQSAAIRFDAGNYRVFSFGVPIETLKRGEDRRTVLGAALGFFEEGKKL